jgi:hemerythrin-like domain-containing protein
MQDTVDGGATMSTEARSAAPARTEEIAVIHRIFRRGFPMMAELVRQAPVGATARSQPIAAHLDFLLNGLHNHHSGEDENVWPLLLERAALQTELITRMEQQHKVVAERSERVRSLLETWRRTPVESEALATALDEFTAALVVHLDDEEAHVVPLLRIHITAQEWTRFGRETFEKFTNAEKLVATGTLEDVATPEEATWFIGDLPLPIKLMWRVSGRRQYARYMRRVLGTAA